MGEHIIDDKKVDIIIASRTSVMEWFISQNLGQIGAVSVLFGFILSCILEHAEIDYEYGRL